MKTIPMLTAVVRGEHQVVTGEQIRAAYGAGNCRLLRSRAENHTKTSLSLDGADIDSRGQCYSMRDEQWTHPAESLQRAIQAAYTPMY